MIGRLGVAALVARAAAAVGLAPVVLAWLLAAAAPMGPVVSAVTAPAMLAPVLLLAAAPHARAQMSCENPPEDEPDNDGDECTTYTPAATMAKANGSNTGGDCNQPALTCGDPINISTGNEYEAESDYLGGGPFPLVLTRFYNSMDVGVSPFGQNWRATYTRMLTRPAPNQVNITRDDGQVISFHYQSGRWVPDSNMNISLRQTAPVGVIKAGVVFATFTPGSDSESVWVFTNSKYERETYSPTGRLLGITNRAGLRQSLGYDTAGRLTSVTDPFGRKLIYAYGGTSSAPTITVTVPDGGTHVYGFDSSRRLVSVTHPDGTSVAYAYANTSFPNALTSKTDENGTNYLTVTYDSSGRATSSTHPNGVDKTSVDYTYIALGFVTVTNPLGGQRESAFASIAGTPVEYQVWRVCPSNCTSYYNSNPYTTNYDSNGNPVSTTDWINNVTLYTYNLATNLQTSRTEASGTSYARTITTTWNVPYRLPLTITEPGRATSFTYDAFGNLLQRAVTDTALSVTRTWTWTYNSAGQVLTATDPLGHTSTIAYDGSGNIATITNAAGQVLTFTSHDADGRPLSVTDPNGVVTTLAYDFRGHVTSRNVGGALTSYAYDKTGLLSKLTMPDGSFITFTRDAAHRLTGFTDALGNSTAYTLDAAGNRTAMTVTNAAKATVYTHTWSYDPFSRLAKDQGGTSPATEVTSYLYNDNDTLNEVSDPLGHTTYTPIDELSRVTQSTDPTGAASYFTYDALDHLVSVRDPRSNTTAYTFDAFNETTKLVSPDSGASATVFDAAGNATKGTDARGVVTNITYDALNRPSATVYPGNTAENVTRGYDSGTNGAGHLTSVTDAAGTLALTYDGRGNVLSEARAATGGVTLNTVYTYDLADHVTSMTYPSGLVVRYARDAMGRISGITAQAPGAANPATIVSGVSYLAFGTVKSFSYGNGIVRAKTFDLDARVTRITDAATATIKQLSYTYDAAGRITAITDGVTAANSQSFSYDADSRLTSATGNYGTVSYTYDTLGNRTADSASTYTYAATSNQVLTVAPKSTGTKQTYAYTASGSVASITPASGTATALSYNQAGRLASVSSGTTILASDTYDAFGRRIVKANAAGVTALFQYDRAGHLIEETTAAGVAKDDVIWLGDEPVGMFTPATGAFSFMHGDVLGTPQLLTDANQATAWAATYQPFGGLSTTSGTQTQNLRFPGQYADAETGFYQNGFRDYSPGIGRYLESDQIGLVGGLNTYAYVLGNPVGGIDPYGLFQWSPLVKAFETAAAEEAAGLGPENPVADLVALATLAVGLEQALEARSLAPATDSSDCNRPKILYHYTTANGMAGILASQQINPSLAANNPNDVRYGEGVYLSDIPPGTMTSSQLSREFLGFPFQGQRFTNYVSIDVTGIPIVMGRPNVYVIPTTQPLTVAGRITGAGSN